MNTPTKEQIEEAAHNHVDLQYPGGVERQYPIDDFTAGVMWLQQQGLWNETISKLPAFGIEVIGFNKLWIDEDVNPNGTCVCYLQDEEIPYFIIAKYCNQHDEWHTRYSHTAAESLGEQFGGYDYIDAPTHWHLMIPSPSN